jgi:heme/copper-type cytochrome/quinol oxidase subunit 2
MLIAFILVVSIVLTYLFIRPFMKTPQQRTRMVKLFFVLIPAAIVFYLAVTYFTFNDKPASFKTGVELLQTNKYIKNKIGYYDSYSYYDKDLPKKTDNPAFFKVSLKGSSATIYLSCKIQKDTLGEWHLTEIRQDSLGK